MPRPGHVMTASEVARLFGGSPAVPRPRPAPTRPDRPRRLPALPSELMNTFGLTMELAVYRPAAPTAVEPPVRVGGGWTQRAVTLLLVASLLLGWGALGAAALTSIAGYGAIPVAGYALAALHVPGVRPLLVGLPLLLVLILFRLAARRRAVDDAELIASQPQETAPPTV